MPTAFPAVLSATLSGAGFGLLAWLGLSIVLLHARADLAAALSPLQLCALIAGAALAATALPARTGPSRRARLRRAATGGALLAAAATALVLAAWPPSADRALALGLLGLLLVASALAAIACAGVGAGPEPPSALAVRLLAALAPGLGLLFWLMALLLPIGGAGGGMPSILCLLGVLLAACAAWRWQVTPGGAPPARWRLAALALMAGGPLLGWGLAALGLPASLLLACATLSLIAGAGLERRFAPAP
ncbi:hypothetical protein [Luteimonas huabeiensis]|uniref:hypothetical protein n=1 Tax=Luteimonas huabeiensis TaxID=1244513 RepID=UPI000464BED5|nr:hypothetical protein [Luteimonas huabeiensis]